MVPMKYYSSKESVYTDHFVYARNNNNLLARAFSSSEVKIYFIKIITEIKIYIHIELIYNNNHYNGNFNNLELWTFIQHPDFFNLGIDNNNNNITITINDIKYTLNQIPVLDLLKHMKFTSTTALNDSTQQEVTYTSSDKKFTLKITVTNKKTINHNYSIYNYYFIKSIEIITQSQSQSLHINLNTLLLYIYIKYNKYNPIDITIKDITKDHVTLYTLYTIVNDTSNPYTDPLPYHIK